VGRPIELVQVQDAAGAAAAMAGGAGGAGGGVGTGMGGMASPDLPGMLQLGLVLALFGSLLWVVKRRQGRER
jgi:hypothetical protein